jgi:hypothetical protein
MLIHTLTHTIPVAYSLLPEKMRSERATAMLLAIGLQESKFKHRRQIRGPARGFFQFELGGIVGVMTHPATRAHARNLLETLGYPEATSFSVHDAIEHNDTVACGFARLLLWTVPMPLPTRDESNLGWNTYIDGWRPGKPHPETWDANFRAAWNLVDARAAADRS